MKNETTPKLLRLNLQHFSEPNPEPTPEKTFTQAELDAILKDRLARNNTKFADYDDVKAKLTEYEQAQQKKADEELSAVERLEKQLADKEAAELALTAKLDEVKAQATQERIRNAFVQVATTNEITYVDAALKLADLTAVEVGEDGTLSGVDEIVKTLIAVNPFLIAKKPQQPIGDPANGGKDPNEQTAEQLLEEAADKARKSGLPADRAAYAKLKRELSK